MTRGVYRPEFGPSIRAIVLGADLALQALLEPLDLARGVDDRLLARVERMAVATDIDAELGTRGTDDPLGPAGPAVHLGFEILGMDLGLHAISAGAAAAGMTRTRFFVLVANSNLTLPSV